jgi:hypothetical protein
MAKYRHRMYKAHCLLNSQLYLYMYLLYIYINLDGHRNSFLFILSPKSIKRAGYLRKFCIFRAWEAVNTVPKEPQRRKDFFFQIYILLLPLAFSYYHSKLCVRFLNSSRNILFVGYKIIATLAVCVYRWFSKDYCTISYLVLSL